VTKEAKVVRISPSVDAMTRTVEIVADIDNRDGQLKPGMLADVELAGKTGQAAPAPAPAPAKADAAGAKAAAEPPKVPEKPAQEATR
jgi:multidrug efflux pump subunit AcrA (membrane-fusion protein)